MVLRILLFTVLLCCTALKPAFAEKINIALLPINMDAAGKYQYLGGALHSMLAGRLASDGNVAVIDGVITREDLNLPEGTADSEGNLSGKPRVDFVGSGFCYETADGMKLQMNFFSRQHGKEPITLTMTTEGETAILSELDAFAAEIKNRVFGFEQYTLSGAASADEALGAFQTSHPEKAYKMGEYAGAVGGGENSGSLVSMGIRTAITVNDGVVNMDSGDLDGDGILEHVLLSRTGLAIVKVNEGRLHVVDDYSFSKGYKANRLYLADIDGDGKSEIYVSGDKRFAASSMILLWNQAEGVTVSADNIAWYIRPLASWKDKPVVIGQRSSRNRETGFLGRGIFELEQDRKNGQFVGWKRFNLPDRVNIFDFVLADLNGDGMQETVAIDRNEELMVYSPAGELLSVSEDSYGGSLVHFGPTNAEIDNQTDIIQGNVSKETARDRTIIYIPEPMLARDIDGDGTDEIIVGKNQFQGLRMLVNSRSYSGGSVVCLKWGNDRFTEIWKTKKYPGYLSAYTVWPTGTAAAENSGKDIKNMRMIVSYAAKSSFLGLSVADKTKVETFSFEIQ